MLPSKADIALRQRCFEALARYGVRGASPTELSNELAEPVQRVRSALLSLEAAKQVFIRKNDLKWAVRRGAARSGDPHGRAARESGSVTGTNHTNQTGNGSAGRN